MPDDRSPYHKSDDDIQTQNSDTALRRWVIVRHATVWHPPTDVYELDGRLIVVVEIAGMRDSDISVVLQGQRLVISGVRERVTRRDCAYHQLEIPYGEFRTEVNVPWPVAHEDVTANYRDGLLRVELPHAPAQKIQIINVDNEDDAEPTDQSPDRQAKE